MLLKNLGSTVGCCYSCHFTSTLTSCLQGPSKKRSRPSVVGSNY